MDILRFITAGSVDDGKSTLIGRLLYDTDNIKTDILDSVTATENGTRSVNLAHLTDGLRAERQQSITIDVAYKYFTTPNRKYIITDAPGHFQYTRNLVTGASNADVIIILIDATQGITEQTRRHTAVASFLRIKHIVVAINKMDLVAYDETVYNNILAGYLKMIGASEVTFIPMSALNGDNVTVHSDKMPWYTGKTLLEYLEQAPAAKTGKNQDLRFAVQYVTDEKCYGKLIAGILKIGDVVQINPGGNHATIKKIIHSYRAAPEAAPEQNICLIFDLRTAVRRGSLLSYTGRPPQVGRELDAELCWLDDTRNLALNKYYILRINTTETVCRVVKSTSEVSVNEFATIKIVTEKTIAFDPWSAHPETGRGILVDLETNYTAGAVIVL